MSEFLPTSEFKWIDPKDFDVNKYYKNGLESDLYYLKKLRELHNDYSLASDKKEIKK